MLFADGLLNFHSLNPYLLSTSSVLGPVLGRDEIVHKIELLFHAIYIWRENWVINEKYKYSQ